jgi:hypothetical protein
MFIAPIAASLASAMGASAATASTIGTVASVAGTVASTGLGIASSIQNTRAQQAQATANAREMKYNAKQTYLQNANEQYLQNANEQYIERLRANELISEQRAVLAKTGMDLGSGTPDFLTRTTSRNLRYQSDVRESSLKNWGQVFTFDNW